MQFRGEVEKSAMAEYLKSYRWDDFITVTFDPEKSYTKTGRKEPYYASKTVWNELAENNNVARAFIAVEPHQSGDLHIHGLIAGSIRSNGNLIYPENVIWQNLFDKYGRSKVEKCRDVPAVTDYCAKYILKQQSRVCDYYNFYGNRLAWQRGKIN